MTACPSFFERIATLPSLGFGIGMKDVYCEDLLEHQETVDWAEQVEWVELIPENYMNKGGRSRQVLQQLVDGGFAVASHGVNLSLGSVDPLNPHYLDSLQALFQQVHPVWFSDHLSFSSVNQQYLNDLLPLPFSQEAVTHCVNKIREIQSRFTQPFLIENISYYAAFPTEDQLSEAAFITEIVEQADCGLLLDVNNVFVNAQNHHYDPFRFMAQLPLERVVEIHIAGHLETDNMIIDTHGSPVRPEVFDLLSWAYPRCPNLKGVLLERDTNLPDFPVLLDELQAVRLAAFQSTVTAGGVLLS